MNQLNTPVSIEQHSVESYSKHRPPGSEFVAIINDKVVGYIGYHTPTKLKSNSHVLEINIGVHPDFQRKGVGRELLNYMFSWVKENGYKKVSIRVLSSNISAIPFYLSYGFKEQGRLKDEFIIDWKICRRYFNVQKTITDWVSERDSIPDNLRIDVYSLS